jgi:NitT/TauT family transport system substrate-binding protein
MPNAIAAMERGDIDCYLRTVGEYQGLGRRKDTQGIIIGTIDVSTGGDGWAADASIQSVCDLKGQTIAVEPNLPARLLLQASASGHQPGPISRSGSAWPRSRACSPRGCW